jgi:biopolymer transport protein ExbD
MGQRLEQIFKTRAGRIVFVKGDSAVEFQYVARSLDVARGSGIDITMITTPMQPGGIRAELVTTKTPRHTSLSEVRANNAVPLPWADGDDQVVVLVTRAGEIRLGPIPVKPEELTSLTSRAFAARVASQVGFPPPPAGMPKQAFIKSDARAPWGKIIEVVDRLAVAGINELGFLVSPQ